jgi:amino acid transporter
LALNFHGSWLAAALIAVLAPVYIFYGFESCGDIAEETQDAGRRIPRAMRLALIWGGITSLVLTAALLLAMPKHNPVGATVTGGGVPFILGQLSQGLQDFTLVLIIYAFFSCGTSIQGAGSRLAFSYARDGALPGSRFISRVHPRFKTPVNALLAGVVITVLFCLLVFVAPKHNVHIWFIIYPAKTTALLALVSFAVSGIYLSFFLTVIASMIARARGWVPEGTFRLGRWGWIVSIIAAAYLALIFIDIAFPSGIASPREVFNLDWMTLAVIFVIAVVGAVYFVIGRPDRKVSGHVHDELEATGAERVTV